MLHLPDLPRPASSRLAVRLTPDALRQVRGGHPWVFDSSVRSVNREGAAGDLAVVFGDRREFAAIGLWDPESPIRLRVLHHGRPVTIDSGFWRSRWASALGRRAGLLADPATTGLRLLHGENDGLPGLVADAYDTTVVVKVYSSAWLPHLVDVLGALSEAAIGAGLGLDRIVVRLGRNVARGETHGLADGDVVLGDPPPGPVRFLENGLTFEADVIGGQKTGHFLDQRDNRARVRDLSAGRRVLDVFACTGGFSVHAAAGGATEVTSVDLSRRSLATASANFAHNTGDEAVRRARHDVIVGDAFEVMEDLRRRRRRFDLVIVDPPSFAPRERDRTGAVEAYGRLAELGIGLVEPGGTYVQSSCSSRVTIDEFRGAVLGAADRSARGLTVLDETTHAADHPVAFPHGAYLKTLFARVDG